MLGQRASSQTVCRPPSRMIPRSSPKRVLADGARTFIQAGRSRVSSDHGIRQPREAGRTIWNCSQGAGTAGRRSSTVTGRPASAVTDVNWASFSPQASNSSYTPRSRSAFSENPWLVTQRAQRTPIDAILRSSTHTPEACGLERVALDVEVGQGGDQHRSRSRT